MASISSPIVRSICAGHSINSTSNSRTKATANLTARRSWSSGSGAPAAFIFCSADSKSSRAPHFLQCTTGNRFISPHWLQRIIKTLSSMVRSYFAGLSGLASVLAPSAGLSPPLGWAWDAFAVFL